MLHMEGGNVMEKTFLEEKYMMKYLNGNKIVVINMHF